MSRKDFHRNNIYFLLLYGVPKTNPFPARLIEAQQNGLQRIADACSVKKTDVLGWAVNAIIAYFDAHKGRLIVPFIFDSETKLPTISNNIRQEGRGQRAKQVNK